MKFILLLIVDLSKVNIYYKVTEKHNKNSVVCNTSFLFINIHKNETNLCEYQNTIMNDVKCLICYVKSIVKLSKLKSNKKKLHHFCPTLLSKPLMTNAHICLERWRKFHLTFFIWIINGSYKVSIICLISFSSDL